MNANFAVLAGGAQPLTYTWLKNGEAIPPATTSLLLTNLQSSDAGSYQVIVGNAVGSVTSADAVRSSSHERITLPNCQMRET